MSPRPKHITSFGNLQEAIKETAWRQISEFGAPALSLRGIARELAITAPAIYNYYPSRDELVTALIIDAYISLGDSLIAARDAVEEHDLKGRFLATGIAYRKWALTYPQRYQLIFGTPIPGYIAPYERVFPSAARSLSALVSVIEGLRVRGWLNASDFPPIAQVHADDFAVWKTHGGDVDMLSFSIAILVWARVHGLVSLEIAGNIPHFGPDVEVFYQYELASLSQQFIKER